MGKFNFSALLYAYCKISADSALIIILLLGSKAFKEIFG